MTAHDDYHEAFARIYDGMRAAYLDVDEDCDQFIAATRPPAGARVLDIGSGTGVHAAELGRRGYDVIGLEPAPAMLERARKRVESAADLYQQPWEELDEVVAPASIDAAVSFANVLNCLGDDAAIARALQALARALRPGARALIDVWNLGRLRKDGTHDTVRSLEGPAGTLVQTSTARLDLDGATLTVAYRIFEPVDGGLHRQVVSVHRLQLLDEDGYRTAFGEAGLDVLAVLPQRPRAATGSGDGEALQSWLVGRPSE